MERNKQEIVVDVVVIINLVAFDPTTCTIVDIRQSVDIGGHCSPVGTNYNNN